MLGIISEEIKSQVNLLYDLMSGMLALAVCNLC